MLGFARTLARRWSVNHNPTAAAAIAFYAIFLLAPVLFFSVAATGRVVGDASARESVERWLGETVGQERAAELLGAISAPHRRHNWALGVISAGMLLVMASKAFVQVRMTLHDIFHVEYDSFRDKIWSTVVGRALAALFAAAAGLLLVTLMIATTLLGIGGAGWLANLALQVGAVVVVTALFAVVMLRLPRRSPPIWDVLIGSLVAAVLFEIGRALMTWYLGHSALAAAYGASGALVAVLIWTYYSAQIFLLGAEIAQVRSESRGAASNPTRTEKSNG